MKKWYNLTGYADGARFDNEEAARNAVQWIESMGQSSKIAKFQSSVFETLKEFVASRPAQELQAWSEKRGQRSESVSSRMERLLDEALAFANEFDGQPEDPMRGVARDAGYSLRWEDVTSNTGGRNVTTFATKAVAEQAADWLGTHLKHLQKNIVGEACFSTLKQYQDSTAGRQLATWWKKQQSKGQK